jgi:hypothetical protein
MQILKGHVSPETAYTVADYPYGFRLRCTIRYWLEFQPKKGFRFVSQTTNPKRGDIWNKPKASTYCRFGGCMYLDDSGHVQWAGLSEYSNGAEAIAFQERYGEGVPEAGRDILSRWVAAKVAYDTNRESGDPLANGLTEARKAFVNPAPVTREQKLALVWKNTHSDFKGTHEGVKTIMVYRQGTRLVPLDNLTDAEIADRLPKTS